MRRLTRTLTLLVVALASVAARPRPPLPPPKPVTSPITASTCASCATRGPWVWGGHDGEVVVSWLDGSFRALLRFFDAFGNGGSEVSVPGGQQFTLAGVAPASDGWVVGWFEPGSRLLMQRLDSAGMPAGEATQVNADHPLGADDDNGTMVGSDGRVIFVFSRTLPGPDADPLVALVNAEDGSRIGGPFTLGTSFNRAGAVACLRPDGGVSAAWSLLAKDPIPDGPNPVGVAVGRLGAGSAAAGAMTVLQPPTLLSPVIVPGQAVACARNGTFAVAWHTNSKPARKGWDVVWQRFDSLGRKQGAVQTLNAGQDGDQLNPALLFYPDGSALAAWESTSGGASVLTGRRFAANGSPQGGDFPLHIAGNGQTATAPVLVAIPGTGRFVLGWNEDGKAWVQIFSE
jgi:hypothetical protein